VQEYDPNRLGRGYADFPPADIRVRPDVWGGWRWQYQAMYWDHMNGWGWTVMVVWSLVWIGFLIVLVWAVVEWARRSPQQPQSPQQPPRKSARELLDERLATGEIDPDEYQHRREALEQRTPIGV
jgi:putative membrane protein